MEKKEEVVNTPAHIYARAVVMAPEADEISVMACKQTGTTEPFESYTIMAYIKRRVIAHASVCLYTLDDAYADFQEKLTMYREKIAAMPATCPTCGHTETVTRCDACGLPVADSENVGHDCDLHAGCCDPPLTDLRAECVGREGA